MRDKLVYYIYKQLYKYLLWINTIMIICNFIMIYSPHVYENAFNSILNVIFIKFINNAIDKENFSVDVCQWKLKQTMYGIMVSKIIKLLII